MLDQTRHFRRLTRNPRAALRAFRRSSYQRTQRIPNPPAAPPPPAKPALPPLPADCPRRHGLSPAYAVGVALEGLLRNRTRSFLAMLGIIIGVGSVITMMGLGEGSRQAIEERIRGLGTNYMFVRTGDARQGAVHQGAETVQHLTPEDARAILRECPAVVGASPRLNGTSQVKHGDRNTRTDVVGITSDFFKIREYPIDRGRLFSPIEIQKRARVSVIGPTLAQTLFGNHDALGKIIRVKGQPFTVIGILHPRGGVDGDWDERAWIPISTAMLRLGHARYIDRIEAQAASESQIDEAAEQITKTLRKRHKLRDDQDNDFDIRTQSDILETATQTSRFMGALLAGIAGVSLLVGGIGIMNIMLVSVTERTREIGIRRAIGARRADILAQFLIEALVMCGLGALLGIVAGLLGCWVGATQAQWPISITAFAPTVSCGCAIFIGLVFGIYPAYRASRLSPLDALRYGR